MKKVTLLFMVLFIAWWVGNGCRKDDSFKEDIVTLTQNRSAFSDTTGWEHMYIYNFLKSMDTSELVSFLNTFGSPLWEYSYQKRSEGIKITTVPLLYRDSINGVIRLYVTNENYIKVDFFSKLEMNESILRQDLNNEEFQLFKGAVQSFITTEYLYCGHVNNSYLSWLIENKDRPESRVAWYCIEEWECEGVYTSTNTGWSYDSSITFNQIGVNLGNEERCILLSRECFIDYTPRNFPSTIYSGGSGGSNGNTGGGTTGSTGGGGSGSSNDNVTIRNAKIQFLIEFFNFTGISPIHQEILYACIGVLTVPNYSPSGIIDVTSDMKCIRGQLGAEISKILGLSAAEIEKLSIQELYKKTKVADCLRKTGGTQDAEKEKLLEFYQNTDLIDPCSGEEINKDDIILSLCQNNKVNMDGLEDALQGNPHIKLSKNLATDCPKLNCILNKLLGEGEPSSDFLCNMLDQFDGNPTIGIVTTLPRVGEPNFLGKTEVIKGKNILIHFNKNNCTSIEVLDLFETFQHELIHADFFRQLFEDYGWTGDYLSLDETFKKLVEFKYGPDATPDQHVLMLNELLPDMINSLMQANGSSIQCYGNETSGDCFYFKTLILNGFSEELLENELGISYDLHTNNLTLYNLWKVSQPLYNTLNNCL